MWVQRVRAALQQQSRIPERISRHLNDQISALREAFLVKGLKGETPKKSNKILDFGKLFKIKWRQHGEGERNTLTEIVIFQCSNL
jgi:hypothetical protein